MKMLSVVIPVYNEEENLPLLFNRLLPSLDSLNKPYEIILTNDGSKDTSLEILQKYQKQRSDVINVINFDGNFGQHMAIIAGFEIAKGNHIITLDADLQNPPEEIYKLVNALENGHDVVGTYRANRQDTFFRKYASRIINAFRHITTGIAMRDHGCMLRGYNRNIVKRILATDDMNAFIPATAQSFAHNSVEIEVKHAERAFGESKYSLYSLIRLNFDLMTGYSIIPLQIFTLIGVLVSLGSFTLVGILIYRRLFLGSEAEGLFTLFAIMFFLIGVMITGLGIVGEYIGRIYQQVRGRPKYEVLDIIRATGFSAKAKPVKGVSKKSVAKKTVSKKPATKRK
jgi:undecaprenyl-phosphate 4-deoxy-4-formamido-L-arabinose transferase